jgi:hypothetical protein
VVIVRTSLPAVSVVVLSLLAAACGSDSPSTPAPPPATTQSIAVTGPDRVFIGASETYTATATMSDGTTRAVTSGWAGDAPSVVTVEPGGRVTGVGSGMVTVYVIHDGRQGQKVVRGLPNFQGVWSGSYAVRSCSQSGQVASANMCGDLFSVNRVLPTNLNITQDADRVEGRFFLGTVGGDISGSVQTDGRYLASGVIRDGSWTVESSWTLESHVAGRVTGGGFSLLWRFAGATGDVRVTADIRDLNRTSSINASLEAPPAASPRDLPGLLRALTVRR